MAGPTTNVTAVRVTAQNGATKTLTPDQFQHYVARLTQAWRVERDQAHALMGRLEGQHGPAVTNALNKLRAEMSGLATAFGITPPGSQLQSQWEKVLWPAIQQQIEQMAQGYHTGAAGWLSELEAALDANEKANMRSFERVLRQLV